jgi:hypothetical protein
MSSKTPMEIWHAILKYSIYVPLFLDSDPVETYGIDIIRQYSYEFPYWQSERTRNSLRRVCHAWNEFLQLYAHRFVRLDDVAHQRVPPSALSRALRIDLDGERDCACEEFCYTDSGSVLWVNMRDAWFSALSSMQNGMDEAKWNHWKVEIIKGWLSGESNRFHLIRRRAPSLKVMICQGLGLYDSPEDLPQGLRLFSVESLNGLSSLDICGFTFLTALHMTLLTLRIRTDGWDLPLLLHLSVACNEHSRPSLQDELYFLLQGVGPQLRTFHFLHPLLPESMESRLWAVLPRVESIRLPYIWKDCNIPLEHPLQRVQICVEDISNLETARRRHDISTSSYPQYIPNNLDRRWIIRLDTTWNKALFSSNAMTALSIYDYCQDLCTPLIDVHGDTFTDYVLFLITAFWKQPERKYHRIVTESIYGDPFF